MKKKNLLIEKSFKYEENNLSLKVEGCFFDDEKGYWIDVTNDLPLVLSNRVKGLQTKKEDIETGEDKKGE